VNYSYIEKKLSIERKYCGALLIDLSKGNSDFVQINNSLFSNIKVVCNDASTNEIN
jgi:hypothetical protein